jgi:hypothetical protein
MKDGVIISISLPFALDGGEWTASCFSLLCPEKLIDQLIYPFKYEVEQALDLNSVL